MQDPNLLPEELRDKERKIKKEKINVEKIKLSTPVEFKKNKEEGNFLNTFKSFFSKKSIQKIKNKESQSSSIIDKSADLRIELKKGGSFREKASLLASAPLPELPIKEIKFKELKQNKKEENEQQRPKGIEINLIPEEMRSFVKPTKQIENFWKFFICSIIIVGIFYGGLHLYKLNINKQFQNVQNQMKKINDELVNYSEFKEKEQSTQMRIKVTQKLIDNHIYATNILSFLEDNTLKDIIYTNLDFNSTLSQNNKTESITKINIEGVSKDFATIKNQLLIFQNVANFVKKVEISELLSTKEQKKKKEFKGLDGIGFKMDIELQPGILQKTF